MKKGKITILASVIAMLLVAGAVGAGTLAYFSDTETATGNTFTAGTLDVWMSSSNLLPNAENMAPGDTEIGYVVIKNTGSLDMIFRVYLNNIQEDEPGFRNYFDVKVDLLNNLEALGIYTGNYDLYGPPGEENQYVGSLTGLVGRSKALDNVDAALQDNQPLWPAYAAVYRITVTMDFDTPDKYQMKNFSADIVVEATQAANQQYGSVKW